MRFSRAISVVLVLMSPVLALQPAGLDALLIHSHAHEDLHDHGISLPDTLHAHNDNHDHDGHSPVPSRSTMARSRTMALSTTLAPSAPMPFWTTVDDLEFVVVFPKLLLATRSTPLRTVQASERPAPPWRNVLCHKEEPDQARLLPRPGLPPPALHCSLSKRAALLLINHALLL